MSGIELRCLKFSNTYFFNANFEGANFKKVEFDNCDLPNCNFRNSFLNDVSFKETRFCGSNISGASVAFTHFDDYAVEDKLIYKPISYPQGSAHFLQNRDANAELFRRFGYWSGEVIAQDFASYGLRRRRRRIA